MRNGNVSHVGLIVDNSAVDLFRFRPARDRDRRRPSGFGVLGASASCLRSRGRFEYKKTDRAIRFCLGETEAAEQSVADEEPTN